MTQETAPGNKTHHGKANIKNVNHALKELRSIIVKEEITSIALPRLATGVGGIKWSEIEPLIEEYLGSLKIPVIIYEIYNKGEMTPENLPNTA